MTEDGQESLAAVWRELAALVSTLPLEERQRCQDAIHLLVHDLRQDSGVIYGAEALLRRETASQTGLIELLDIIRTANRHAMGLLTEFARPFDHEEITLPGQKPPPASNT